MGYRSTYSGCKVRVDGIPLAQSRFVIHASVEYDERLSSRERARLLPGTQMKVILAVLGEAERGLQLGSRSIRIAVVGDAQLERLFREWTPGAEAAPPAAGPRRLAAVPQRLRLAAGADAAH